MTVYAPSDVPLYYLVGRMSDQDDLHVLEFLLAQATIRLRKRKGTVVIPHAVTGQDPIDYVLQFQAAPKVTQEKIDHEDYSNSVRFILDNRPIIIALRSWHASPGAKTELAVAIRLGLTVLFWNGDNFCNAPAEFTRLFDCIKGQGLFLYEVDSAPET